MPTRASTSAAAGPSSGRPQRAAAQKGRQQIQDTIMRDESPPVTARPARVSASTVVKNEEAELDTRPDTRESVHSMLITLAKQLAALQAERRKLKKPR